MSALRHKKFAFPYRLGLTALAFLLIIFVLTLIEVKMLIYSDLGILGFLGYLIIAFYFLYVLAIGILKKDAKFGVTPKLYYILLAIFGIFSLAIDKVMFDEIADSIQMGWPLETPILLISQGVKIFIIGLLVVFFRQAVRDEQQPFKDAIFW